MTREEAEALAKSQTRYQVMVQVWKAGCCGFDRIFGRVL